VPLKSVMLTAESVAWVFIRLPLEEIERPGVWLKVG
jgi:hypothetical protein